MKNIPRIRIENPEELYQNYILQNKPVVIINFQDNWANSSAFTKRSLDEKVKKKHQIILILIKMIIINYFDKKYNFSLRDIIYKNKYFFIIHFFIVNIIK